MKLSLNSSRYLFTGIAIVSLAITVISLIPGQYNLPGFLLPALGLLLLILLSILFFKINNESDQSKTGVNSVAETIAGNAVAQEISGKEKMRKKAEADLSKSNHRYQTLAESSPVGIFHTDATGYTTYVNPRWCQISGMAAEDALGNGWFNAVHEDDRQALREGWEDASKSLRHSTSEYRLVRPDGSVAWVIGQAIPEKNDEGEIVGYVGTTTDITERKKAEQEIAKLLQEKETVLNRINDGMVSVDREWRYTFINDAALANHPLGREGTIGKVIWDIHPEMKDTVFWDKYHEAFSSGKVMEIESFYEPMDRYFFVKLYPSHDGLTILYRDITERKKADDEIINERNLSDSIINSLPGVFYLYNKQGTLLRWNNNLEKVVGYTREEIKHLQPLDFVNDAEKNLVEKKIENVFIVGEENVQAGLLKKTKEVIPYYFTGKAIEYMGQSCFLGVGLDYSDRLKAQEEIKETSDKLHQLTAHLLSVREEERKRIAREIHDELGQQLTAINMDTAWIDKNMPAENALMKTKLKNIRVLLHESHQSIRRILNELRPGILDDLMLLEAIEWLGSQFYSTTGIHFDFKTDVTENKFQEKIALCIFRIYQEALTNITRYSRAKTVSSSLNIINHFIEVKIKDDGQGFDPSAVQSNRSFGILGMNERVFAFGGKFELFSSPGQGTSIMILLPEQLTAS